MKKRHRRVLLVSLGALFGLVLAALAFVFSVVREDAPYGFMRGARQDGYWVSEASKSGEVSRFFTMDKAIDEVAQKAREELTSEHGWSVQHVRDDAGEAWMFSRGPFNSSWSSTPYDIVAITRSAGSDSTFFTVTRNATKGERAIAKVYESLPERHADWR